MGFQNLPIVTPRKVLEKRGIREPPFSADMAIICFRGRQACAKLVRAFCGSPLREGILYHPSLYHSSRPDLLIVPKMTWGGPVTAIVIEELFTLGVRTLIGFGAGGSINPAIHPGAIFVAEKAICTDGTSRAYSDQVDCGPDPQLLEYYSDRREELDALFLSGLTTDSLYRETPKKIENWRRLGADFINLEVSPFYVVCRILGIRAIYVGLITDSVGEKWKSEYWGVENEVDTRIIESIRGLCADLRSQLPNTPNRKPEIRPNRSRGTH